MPRNKAVVNLWDTATALATTSSITSSVVGQKVSMGYATLLIILAGSSPSVNITITAAKTETDTFYTPYDTSGTSLGTIYSSLTTSRWIEFSPPLAPYVKITITGTGSNGANTTVRAYLIFEEEFR